jgi:hypothetical protein
MHAVQEKQRVRAVNFNPEQMGCEGARAFSRCKRLLKLSREEGIPRETAEGARSRSTRIARVRPLHLFCHAYQRPLPVERVNIFSRPEEFLGLFVEGGKLVLGLGTRKAWRSDPNSDKQQNYKRKSGRQHVENPSRTNK